jgi:hypothetical protein
MMSEHFDFKVKIFLLASPFLLVLSGLTLDVYIACTHHFKTMTQALQRSGCLPFARLMCGERSIKSRVLIISMVSSELMAPNSRIRRGSLNAQDYKEFPKKLKSTIIISAWLNIVGFTWLMLLGLIL